MACEVRRGSHQCFISTRQRAQNGATPAAGGAQVFRQALPQASRPGRLRRHELELTRRYHSHCANPLGAGACAGTPRSGTSSRRSTRNRRRSTTRRAEQCPPAATDHRRGSVLRGASWWAPPALNTGGAARLVEAQGYHRARPGPPDRQTSPGRLLRRAGEQPGRLQRRAPRQASAAGTRPAARPAGGNNSPAQDRRQAPQQPSSRPGARGRRPASPELRTALVGDPDLGQVTTGNSRLSAECSG